MRRDARRARGRSALGVTDTQDGPARVLPVSAPNPTGVDRYREDRPGPPGTTEPSSRGGPGRSSGAWRSRRAADAPSSTVLALVLADRIGVGGRGRRAGRRRRRRASRVHRTPGRRVARRAGRDRRTSRVVAPAPRAVAPAPDPAASPVDPAAPSPAHGDAASEPGTGTRTHVDRARGAGVAPAIQPPAPRLAGRVRPGIGARRRAPTSTAAGTTSGSRRSASTARSSWFPCSRSARARQLRLPLGLRRGEQRLPAGPRVRRVQAAPRRVRRRPAAGGMRADLRRRERPGPHVRRALVEARPADDQRELGVGVAVVAVDDAPDVRRRATASTG